MTVELLLRPEVEKKPYRLKCRFSIDAYPRPEWVEKYKLQVAEQFVNDMERQGWEYDPNVLPVSERGFRLRGPFTTTPLTGLPSHVDRVRMSAAAMLPGVRAGNPYRDSGHDYAATVDPIDSTERWEYEISAVFIRPQIFTEIPDPHEERSIV